MAASAKLEKTSARGIYRKGNRYVVVYRVHGKQRKRSCRTMAEARRVQAEMRADVARGEYREQHDVTFGEYAADWLNTYQGRTTRGFRESTRVGYRRALEQRAIGYFDERCKRLVDVEPRHVRMFVAWLFDEKAQGKRLALSTVRNHVAAVRAMLGTAVEDGVLRHNPATGVRIATSRPATVEDDERARALTREELGRFLAECPEEWRLFFELLTHTGVRIGEAVELRWKDVDLGGKRLRVRRRFYRGDVNEPKSRFGRRDVPLSTGMARALWRVQGADDDLVFANVAGERHAQHVIRHNVLSPTAKAAGVPWATFHSFRHTAASLLFESGKNVKQVQEWLGHSDPGFTLRTYVHLLDDGLGDADFLDDATRERATARATEPTEIEHQSASTAAP